MSISKTHLGDSLDFLKNQADKSFDLCFTDPPYNVGMNYNGNPDKRSDYRDWCGEWFTEAMRVSKCLVFTPGMVNMFDWVEFQRPYAVMSWFKPNQCSASVLRGFNVWEPILVYGKNKYQIPQDGILESIAMQPNASFHPCPKSLRTWQKILGWFARPGDSVLDIFLGSGTTRIAAHNLGIDFAGCEIDPMYFAESEKRYQYHVAQVGLFAPPPIVIETQEALFNA